MEARIKAFVEFTNSPDRSAHIAYVALDEAPTALPPISRGHRYHGPRQWDQWGRTHKLSEGLRENPRLICSGAASSQRPLNRPTPRFSSRNVPRGKSG